MTEVEKVIRQGQKDLAEKLRLFSVSGSFLLRIALSPFLFLYGVFLLMTGTLLPLPLLVIFSVVGFIGTPFVYLLRKSGTDIKYLEPLMKEGVDYENEKNIMRDHFFGATIYVWGAFYVAYHYIKTGKIFTVV